MTTHPRPSYPVTPGAAPVNSVLPAITGSAVQGSVLNVSGGSWTLPLTHPTTYQWQRSNPTATGFNNISGATGVTYRTTSSDTGRTVRCRVTAYNDHGATTVTASGAVLVTAPPPPPPPPTNDIEKATGHTASASSTLPPTTSPSLTYDAAFLTDGSAGTRWQSALAANNEWFQVDLGASLRVSRVEVDWYAAAYATSYTISTGDAAGGPFTIRATVNITAPGTVSTGFPEVTARYVRITGLARSDTRFGIAAYAFRVYGLIDTPAPPPPTAPNSLTLPAVTGTPQTGSLLSCGTGTWADPQSGATLATSALALSYQWVANGTAVSGATSSTWTPPATYVGQTVDCVVTARIVAYGPGDPTGVLASGAVVLSAPPPPPPPPPGRTNSPYFVNLKWGAQGFHSFDWFTSPATGLAACKAMGLQYLRADVQWSQVQPTATSPLNWTLVDSWVLLAAQKGLRFQPIFLHPADWARKYPTTANGGTRFSIPDDGFPMLGGGNGVSQGGGSKLPQWKAFVTAFMQRYGKNGVFWQAGKPGAGLGALFVQAVELLNEWQASSGGNSGKQASVSSAAWRASNYTGQEYVRLYKATWDSAHAVDPDVIVMVGGVTGGSSAIGFTGSNHACAGTVIGHMQAYINANVATYGSMVFDCVPDHCYALLTGTAGTVATTCLGYITEVRNACQAAKNFKDVPIIANEFGWVEFPTGSTIHATAAQRGTLLTEFVVTKKAQWKSLGVVGFNPYADVTPRNDQANQEMWYGYLLPSAAHTPMADALQAAIAAGVL